MPLTQVIDQLNGTALANDKLGRMPRPAQRRGLHMIKDHATRRKRRTRRQRLLAPARRKRRIVPALQNALHIELSLPMPHQIQICHTPSPRTTTKGTGAFVVILPPDCTAATLNYTSTSASERLGTWCTRASSRQ